MDRRGKYWLHPDRQGMCLSHPGRRVLWAPVYSLALVYAWEWVEAYLCALAVLSEVSKLDCLQQWPSSRWDAAFLYL